MTLDLRPEAVLLLDPGFSTATPETRLRFLDFERGARLAEGGLAPDFAETGSAI